MNRITDWLWKACAALGVRLEVGFQLVLPNGRELSTVAQLVDLGAPNGMLLFRSYDDIRDCTQALLDRGYGYAVIDEPRPDEEFDVASFQEMFRDWGWTGDLGSKPIWMR